MKAGGPTATQAKKAAAQNGSNGSNGHANGHATNGSNGHAKVVKAEAKADAKARANERLLLAGVAPKSLDLTTRSEQFAGFQSDAPSCDNCGSICVRAGNCYLCHNCGASQGCS
jgi:ribonucleoside-diphosphate reductase alpha chain